MVRHKKKIKGKKKNKLSKSIGRTAITGLFGGMFWSAMGLICYLLNFSIVGPSLLFAPLTFWKWRNEIGGQLIAITGIGVISILIALIYMLLFSKIKSIWFSIGFGLLLWGCVFFLCQPFLNGLPYLTRLDRNTLTTTLCLYALYGLFIGYSISFDFEENSKGSNYSNQ
ncbi:YqhR family membrane protein [Sporolactobacillus shoreicorticis]|uniref:YqhR family membrane protein n=1 Tax=Sporolactobacillus shoreicorticis TaxID=1923877 RepID=A0ABW5SA30_9BACL|nr:YqhR family membrane protein [Sporolactobacillus shoreicorticis]MCO7126577.1 YqhR family membrane protein [Sporolactobacillus shoreicorticis]